MGKLLGERHTSTREQRLAGLLEREGMSGWYRCGAWTARCALAFRQVVIMSTGPMASGQWGPSPPLDPASGKYGSATTTTTRHRPVPSRSPPALRRQRGVLMVVEPSTAASKHAASSKPATIFSAHASPNGQRRPQRAHPRNTATPAANAPMANAITCQGNVPNTKNQPAPATIRGTGYSHTR